MGVEKRFDELAAAKCGMTSSQAQMRGAEPAAAKCGMTSSQAQVGQP